MIIGVAKEILPDERRVALVPQAVEALRKQGFSVLVEAGAGLRADFGDPKYEEVGAEIVKIAADLWARSDLVVKVAPPQPIPGDGNEVDMLRDGGKLMSFIWPADNTELMHKLAERHATVLAMDCIPRITRAQKMDALSAMANIAGYRAVVEAANDFPRFFAGQTTAAGRIDPAKVLVIGGGVAGLSAVGTAKGMGAIVRAFDTRKAVREEVESLGGEFLELEFVEKGEGEGGYATKMSDAFLDAERKLFAEQAIEVDIIITTALIPNRVAPVLITAGMVESMKEGSVIVDLAAERGGNCALTDPGGKVVHHGVTILGYTDLPSRMATVSSRLYGAAIVALLDDMGGDEGFHVDMEDDVVRGALVVHEGDITWPPPKPRNPGPPYSIDTGQRPADESADDAVGIQEEQASPLNLRPIAALVLTAALLVLLGMYMPDTFLRHFTVFVLACFVGWQVVWNVKPALHTPLMSVTNAISGIILIGGMVQVSGSLTAATTILGAAAVLLAAINVSGGFLVTSRMLAMFKR